MLGLEIGDRDRQVALVVAEAVGLGLPPVHRQLQLETCFDVAQVDQAEALEVQPLGDCQAEGGFPEGQGGASSSTRIME